MTRLRELRSVLNLTVLVAGLGYFVDLFDITLFGVVRVASLKDLGLTDPADILQKGLTIYNAQMAGMMVGGLFWGWLGDRRGRLSVMFGSILLYSAANLLNPFVWDVASYAACRFVGGLGLAGELGAAITLVAESLPKEKRGLGTTVVATLGMLGVVVAALVAQHLPWKVAYVTGGVLGLLLLFTRFRVAESALFTHQAGPGRANPLLLLQRGRFPRYLACILVGVPIYFTTGILFVFAPELTAGLHVQGAVTAGNAILFGSVGLTVGDLLFGLVSQRLQSRKRAVGLGLCAWFALVLVYGLVPGLTPALVYGLSLLIGLCVGYWAVLVTMAAEQFGTNVRATVATTVPNFVRGSAVLAATGFGALKGPLGVAHGALAVGAVCFALALVALAKLTETFHRDLDYVESAHAAPVDEPGAAR